MSESQLRKCFRDYRSAFEGWDVEHHTVLVQKQGPISQHIGFEALSIGSYRPMHYIRILGPPRGGQVLFMFLDIFHREVMADEHETKWPRIVKAMEEQFVPPIREPLDAKRILACIEERDAKGSFGRPISFSTIAALCGHIGDAELASKWLDRSEKAEIELGDWQSDWRAELVTFNSHFRKAIQEGSMQEFLNSSPD